MQRLDLDPVLSLAQAGGAYWLRYNGLLWAGVEPIRGARQWQAAAKLEEGLKAAYAAGLQTILIVRRTPDWAQKVPGSYCGPAAPDALDDLAQFMADAVTRYKDPPYGVKYWELGNEPDVDPALIEPDSVFGCWGDLQDPYYGGGYYARMLQTVYPAIKAADPEAQVLIGGLLLDSDPTLDENPNPPGLFLEGILREGGGEFFDIVSFHGYVWYDGQRHDWENGVSKWTHRGGTITGKTSLLREMLAAYDHDKPLMLTETGLLCYKCPSPPAAEYLEAQAAYVPQLYVKNWALDLRATVWYPLDGPGWRETGLLDRDQQPRPAYHAFSAMTTLLKNAAYLHPVDDFVGLTGHAFTKPTGEVWVLWAPDDTPVSIPLPPDLKQAYDLFGAPLAPEDGTLEVGFSPVYLEFSSR